VTEDEERLEKIDERLVAAAKLLKRKREADVRLDLALSASGVGMWDWEVGHDILVWDSRMCRLFGEPESTAKDLDTFLLKVIPEDRERVKEAVDATLMTGKPYAVFYTIVLPDGSRRKIHARGARHPLQGEAEKLIGVCVEALEDLCEGC
jgi:PAS domain-containing protein